jgi:hypothetical protein
MRSILHRVVYFFKKRNYTVQYTFLGPPMKRALPALLTGVLMTMTYCTLSAKDLAYASPERHEGRFRNPQPMHRMGAMGTLRVMWQMVFQKPADTVPDRAIPVHALTAAQLQAAPEHSVFRLGHSTMLLKLDGGLWLTDPVFSERASPVQWLGPRRFHAPPIAIDALPPIRGVTITTTSTMPPCWRWRRKWTGSSPRWAWATRW